MTDDKDDDTNSNDDRQILNELSYIAMAVHVDLGYIMGSLSLARKSKGIDAEHLEMFWRIDSAMAQKTLKFLSQHIIIKDDPKLSMNYVTGDRMFLYKRIDEYFSMDTFFAMKKAGK